MGLAARMKAALTRVAAAAAILLALAGCDPRKSSNSAAVNVTGEAAALALVPGQWELSVLTPPPPGAPLQPPRTSTTYVSVEQAAEPLRLFAPDAGDSCRDNRIRVADGRISGYAICPGQGSFREVRLELNGSYSQRQFNVTTDMNLGGLRIREERRGRFLRP